MKYFVVHSGKDFDSIKKLINKWSEISDSLQFVVLEGNQSDWEDEATARIRECGKILYVVGKTSYESPYIQKELEISHKEKKDIYVYKLEESNRVNDSLLDAAGTYGMQSGEIEGEIIIKKAQKRIHFYNEDELCNRFFQDSKEVEMILKGNGFDDKDTLMEQYKMFVQTSEDLVSRKQSVNTFYVTLNSLLLGGIISIVCAAADIFQLVSNNAAVYFVSGFLAVIGVVICWSWITLLISYADLNASKMAIISCIEERLALKLFDTEWALLTRRIGKRKYQSFTVKEIGVAKIFLVLYVVLILACVALILAPIIGQIS